MQIRKKLSFQFISFVALILFLSSVSVYFFSADYRKDEFYNRLSNKAVNTARLLISVEEVDASLLKKIEKDNPVKLPEERMTIIDEKEEELYSTDFDNVLKIDEILKQKIRENEEVKYNYGEFEVLGFLFREKGEHFIVVVGAKDIYGKRKLSNLGTVLVVVFSISIILVFVAGWIYAGRALQPISTLVEKVDEITITRLDLRLNEGNGEDEIARLAMTFNKMLDRIELGFKIQKDFIANASHELRTPLAVISGQLEVELMSERSNEEYHKTMLSVLEDIRNLGNISNKLLLLAQASSHAAETEFGPLRVDEIIWDVRAELLKMNPGFQIDIVIGPGIDDDLKMTVIGNDKLLRTALMNLVENACKYSHNKFAEVTLGYQEGSLVIQIHDRGIGISPDDINHIFEPFYRGKNVADIKGHGIGLSLVKTILAVHKGNIEVESEINKGTTFIVSLPL